MTTPFDPIPRPDCPFKRNEKVSVLLDLGEVNTVTGDLVLTERIGYIDSQTLEGTEYLLLLKREDFPKRDWERVTSETGFKCVYRMVPADTVSKLTKNSQVHELTSNTSGPIEVGQEYKSKKATGAEYTVVEVDKQKGIKIQNKESGDAWYTTEKSIRTRYLHMA